MAQMYCFLCNRRFNQRQLARLFTQIEDVRTCAIQRREALGLAHIAADDNSRICLTCRQSVVDEVNIITRDPSCLRLNVCMQRHNHGCIICERTNDTHIVPVQSRVDVFIKQNVYIPDQARACQHHYDSKGYFLSALLPGIPFLYRPYVINGSDLQNFLQAFRTIAVTKKVVEADNLSEDEFLVMTSITKDQFVDLFRYCDPVTESDGKRRIIKDRDLLMFLCKIRQGLSDEFLKVIFEYSSRQVVSMVISCVRRSLMQRFVPGNLGFEAITREQYITQHVTEFANYLYNDEPETRRVIAYMDGTYAPTEKNSNHRILRQTFSLQKKEHLVKPVMVVAPDGYILDVEGPYFADSRNNDSSILNNEFAINPELMNH